MSAGAWVREYAVQIETVNPTDGLESLLAIGDSTGVTFAATKIGIGGNATNNGKFKLLTQNKPDLVSGTDIKESEKASGQADMIEEDIQQTVGEPPKFAPEFYVNSYLISLFMQLMSQSGALDSQFGGVTRDKFTPYNKIDISYYLAVMGKVQKLGGVVDECQLMRGCLPSSLRFSGQEGDVLTLAADLMGAKWSNTFVGTGIPADAQALLKKSYLRWQNANVYMDDAYVTASDPTSGLKTGIDGSNNKFACAGFDLTVTNGLVAKFYNSTNIQAFSLGKYKAEGSFQVPWVVPSLVTEANVYYWKQINDFRNGVVKHMKIWWGNADATTDNSFSIDMYLKYRSGTLEGDETLENNMGFSCVSPASGTPSITLYTGHDTTSLDRGLPAS